MIVKVSGKIDGKEVIFERSEGDQWNVAVPYDLEECIECYRNKYGICKQVDNYVVYFIPQLSMMKLV